MDNRSVCAYCGMVYGEDWCPGECDCQVKKTLIIRHIHSLGGQIKDRCFWEGRLEGEVDVYDYNTKEHLKELAIREGRGYKVLRYHKNGKISVVEEKIYE